MRSAASSVDIRLFCLIKNPTFFGSRFIGCLMILAATGIGSAQEIHWSGMVDSGVKATWGDTIRDADGNKEIRVQATNDDGVDGARATLNAIVYNETRGAKIGIRADYSNTSNLYLYNAYGWVNLFKSIVNVKAGIIDDGVWASPGAGEYQYSTNKGLRVEVKPIDGLNAGAFLNFGGNFGPLTLSQWIQETGFGASYNKRPFDAAAGVKLASDRSPNNEERTKAYFGFRYWGISNFVLSIDGQFENMGNFGKKGFLTLNERVIYQVKDLYSGITFTQVLFGQKTSDDGREKHPFFFRVTTFAEYGLTNSLRGGVEIPIEFLDEEGFTFRSLTVNPWIRYSISGAWIKLNYVFSYTPENFTADNDGDQYHKLALIFTYYF